MSIFARFMPEFMKPYAGRIVFTVFGFVVGILFLTLGFWKTLLLLIVSGIGYALGKWEDGALNLRRLPLPGRFR